jgi:hypothetical protein
MRGKRAKELRRNLAKQYPKLYAQYGKKLKPFTSLFRLVKKGYNDLRRRGYDPRPRVTTA